MGKIPEYPEENLYLFSGASKKKKRSLSYFSALFPIGRKKMKETKSYPTYGELFQSFLLKDFW